MNTKTTTNLPSPSKKGAGFWPGGLVWQVCCPTLSLLSALTRKPGWSLATSRRCSAENNVPAAIMSGASKHARGISSSKHRPPDAVLCVSPPPPRPAPLPLSPPRPVGASARAKKKKSPPPLPSSFHGEDLEVCLLALILRARLAVTQACSRHDSHCGVCSLCLRDKAASVVSPASCFKHHMVALWRSPSSRPPLFLHLSYFPPSVSFCP